MKLIRGMADTSKIAGILGMVDTTTTDMTQIINGHGLQMWNDATRKASGTTAAEPAQTENGGMQHENGNAVNNGISE